MKNTTTTKRIAILNYMHVKECKMSTEAIEHANVMFILNKKSINPCAHCTRYRLCSKL